MSSDATPPVGLDHVTVCASDLAAALRFWDAATAALGWSRVIDLVDEEEGDAPAEAVGYAPPGSPARLWLTGGAGVTQGVHLAFRAGSRSEVESFHAAALAAGGTSHSAPRRWPIYRRGEFHAIVADPDGNLVEAVAGE